MAVLSVFNAAFHLTSIAFVKALRFSSLLLVALSGNVGRGICALATANSLPLGVAFHFVHAPPASSSKATTVLWATIPKVWRN